MKYFIIYKLESDNEVHIAGPYSEFEYIYQAMDIVSYEGVYNLDILNEVAMAFYTAYREVEEEYEEARQHLINSPGCPEWTLQDQVNSNRLLKDIPEELLRAALEDSYTEETLNTISTLETLDKIEDPFDIPF